jgi:hypothetical protein
MSTAEAKKLEKTKKEKSKVLIRNILRKFAIIKLMVNPLVKNNAEAHTG